MEVQIFQYNGGCKNGSSPDFECTGCNNISFRRFHSGIPILWCSREDYSLSNFSSPMTLSWPKGKRRLTVRVKSVPAAAQGSFAATLKQAALEPAPESIYEQFRQVPGNNWTETSVDYCGCRIAEERTGSRSRYPSLFMGACPRLFALLGVQEALGCACPLQCKHEGGTAVTLHIRAVLSCYTTPLPQAEKMELVVESGDSVDALRAHDSLYSNNSFALCCLREHLANTPVVRGLQFQLEFNDSHTTSLTCSSVTLCHLRDDSCRTCGRSYSSPLEISRNTSCSVALRPRPSAQVSKQDALTAPLVGIDRIGGLESVIQELLDFIVLPLVAPWMFEKLGIEASIGVLLHGSPGIGKTFLVESLFEEMNCNWPRLLGRVKLRYASHFVGSKQLLHVAPRVSRLDASTLPKQIAELQFPKAGENSSGSVVFLDNVDSNWSNSHSSWNAWEERAKIERSIIQLFEKHTPFSKCNVIIIATACDPKVMPESLRRAGRFDREIELVSPSTGERLLILKKLLHGVKHNLESYDVEKLARDAQAFVPADLQALCVAAGRNALHRLTGRDAQEPVAVAMTLKATVSSLVIRSSDFIISADFEEALNTVKPSALKQMMVEVPKVAWSDIGGYDNVKHQLQECVEWPIKYEGLFASYGITAPRGILLYGPPGCSKTLLAKAVATESKMNFLAVKGPELYSMWVGESERGVRNVFATARRNAPCIIFFDEIDAVGASRQAVRIGSGVENRVLNQILNEMDGISALKQVVVIGATNRPDVLDPALLRPGRLDRLVLVSLPDMKARKQILQVHLRGVEVADLNTVEALDLGMIAAEFIINSTSSPQDNGSDGNSSSPRSDCGIGEPMLRHAKQVDGLAAANLTKQDNDNEMESTEGRKKAAVRVLAARSDGYTGAELAMLCRESIMVALRDRIVQLKDFTSGEDPPVSHSTGDEKMTVRWNHLKLSLDKMRPRVSPEIVDSFRRFEAKVQFN